MAGNSERMDTVIPNRIFVGGLLESITEDELLAIFEKYGNVTNTKIITDRAGVSKGFGFVTFATAEEANHALENAQDVYLGNRKLNVNKAVRKGSSSSGNGESPRTMLFPYSSYSSSVLGRENCFQTVQLPMMPAYYMQYPQMGNYLPYVYPVSQENYDQGDDDAGKQYRKQNPAQACGTPDYEARSVPSKPYQTPNGTFRLNTGGSPILQHQPVSFHHFVPKTLNGMTFVAYPNPFVMGSPAVLHVKENGDQENLISELSYLHSPLSTNALTPPTTPLAPMPCDFGASPNLENTRKN